MSSSSCETHHMEFEFYCENCKQLICKKCVTIHCKDGHKCLYLEDYGKSYLLSKFDDMVSEIKKNSEQINASPQDSRKAAQDLISSLNALKASLKEEYKKLQSLIVVIERLKDSGFVCPSTEMILRIISQAKDALTGEVTKASGIAQCVEILQSTQDFLTGLTNNVISMNKMKEQVENRSKDKSLDALVDELNRFCMEIKGVSKNRLVGYSIQVGVPLPNTILYGIKEQSNTLTAYSLTKNTLKSPVDIKMEIPNEPCVTQLGMAVYLTGGGNYQSSTIEYLPETGTSAIKSSMSIGKKWHSSVILNDNEFLVVGGYNNVAKHLAVCEKYRVPQDDWIMMPRLSEGKQSAAVCLFERKKVYCFGGYSGKRLNTVESLSVDPLEPKWIVLNLPQINQIEGFSCGAAAQISRSEIIVLRGNNRNESYIFSVAEGSLRKGSLLRKKDSFLLQRLYPIGGRIAGIGYYGHVHLLDLTSQTWEEVEYVLE